MLRMIPARFQTQTCLAADARAMPSLAASASVLAMVLLLRAVGTMSDRLHRGRRQRRPLLGLAAGPLCRCLSRPQTSLEASRRADCCTAAEFAGASVGTAAESAGASVRIAVAWAAAAAAAPLGTGRLLASRAARIQTVTVAA